MAQLPPNSVAIYRICTEKSLLGFGKYEDLPVGDILKVDEEYIVWVYANCEKVSFKKEILDALGVRQIQKPGIDPDILREWKRKQSEQFTEEERKHGAYAKYWGRKRAAKANLARVERSVRRTKGELQAINHGHRKG